MSNIRNEIVNRAKAVAPIFKTVLARTSGFEIKGILNSEMLLFAALLDMVGANRVIESGRARAQSTEVIARWLAEVAPKSQFDSIEFDPLSADVEVARQRMEGAGHPVNAIFGDAFNLLPKLLCEPQGNTVVLIDGPKGVEAAQLALAALSDDNVKAVAIHDVHKDDPTLRSALELWPQFFASDDDQFVQLFRHLDEECWEEHQKYKAFQGWGPYKRADRVMKSYGPTLVCLVNRDDALERRQAIELVQIALRPIILRKKLRRFISKIVPDRIKKNSMVRKIGLRLLGG